jgi:hypothetical protein
VHIPSTLPLFSTLSLWTGGRRACSLEESRGQGRMQTGGLRGQRQGGRLEQRAGRTQPGGVWRPGACCSPRRWRTGRHPGRRRHDLQDGDASSRLAAWLVRVACFGVRPVGCTTSTPVFRNTAPTARLLAAVLKRGG